MSLKIGPIVDRAPVRLALTLSADSHDALADYARIHAQEFGRELALTDLAALMVERFLKTDATFKRARKALHRTPAAKE